MGKLLSIGVSFFVMILGTEEKIMMKKEIPYYIFLINNRHDFFLCPQNHGKREEVL